MISNPKYLLTPKLCIYEIFDKYFGNRKIKNTINKDEIIICCFQECWIYNGSFVSSNRSISLIFYFFSLFSPLFYLDKYNPIVKSVEEIELNNKYFLYQDRKILKYKLTNSGLGILVNKEADSFDFRGFGDGGGFDRLANKGYMWISYDYYKILVINLHLQADEYDKIKYDQLDKIVEFVNNCRWEGYEIYIMGDFNLNIMKEEVEREILYMFSNFVLVSDYRSTSDDGKCLDYFLVRNVKRKYNFSNCKSELSDHNKIVLSF